MFISTQSKLFYIKMTIANAQRFSQISQISVSRIIEFVLVGIIIRIQPFFFELSPNNLSNVQMRGIRGQERNEQSSCLP